MLNGIPKQYERLVPLLKFVFAEAPEGLLKDLKASSINKTKKTQEFNKDALQKILNDVGNVIGNLNAMCAFESIRPGKTYRFKPELYRLIIAFSCVYDELMLHLDQAAKEFGLPALKDRLKQGAELQAIVKAIYPSPEGSLVGVNKILERRFRENMGAEPAKDRLTFFGLVNHPRMLDKLILEAEQVKQAAQAEAKAQAQRAEAEAALRSQAASRVDAKWAAQQFGDYATRSVWNAFGLFKHNRNEALEIAERLEKNKLSVEQLLAEEQERLKDAKEGGGFFVAFQAMKAKVEEEKLKVAAAAGSAPKA